MQKYDSINFNMQKKTPSLKGPIGLALFLVIILILNSPAITGQRLAPEVVPTENNKSVATIMAIVAFMFLFSAFLSLYSGKCTERNQGNNINRFELALPTGETGRRSQNEPSGLNQEVIDTFPTFLYSNVKGLKIGKATLACAICLNEFEDDETLRLIPKCSHVYHHSCIDVWLLSHNTCPVCRANLVPKLDDIANDQMLDHELGTTNEEEEEEMEQEQRQHANVEIAFGDTVVSPKFEILRRCRTSHHPRSKSTGFLSSLLFSRSNSTGTTSLLVHSSGEDCERFTLRLPEEVRNQVMNGTLKRAKSCVSFTRMSSGTCGYRMTRSVGSSGRGSSEEQLTGFSLSFVRNGWNNRSVRKGNLRGSSVDLDDNGGERSYDHLCPV